MAADCKEMSEQCDSVNDEKTIMSTGVNKSSEETFVNGMGVLYLHRMVTTSKKKRRKQASVQDDISWSRI